MECHLFVNWIRAVILRFFGVASLRVDHDALAGSLSALSSHLHAIEARIAEQEKELNRLRMIRRDQAGHSMHLLDWDMVQAMKLAELDRQPKETN